MNIKGKNENQDIVIKKTIETGNSHLFHFWEELTDNEKDELLNTLETIDFAHIEELFNDYKKHSKKEYIIKPTECFMIKDQQNDKTIKQIGENALKQGEVAVLTVAGGQGSRLGYDHPKGCFPVSPIKKKSLFQIFAEKIKSYSEYYNNDFYWYIMTSETNNDETVKYFEKNNFFNLKKENIIFYKQGMFPTLTEEGKYILKNKYSLFRNPDGHGGILKALSKTGLLKNIQEKGIKYLSYFQVDNPLVNMADPYFIGYHIKKNSEVSSKVIAKLYPEERIGSICKINNKNQVIEYSDLPEKLMYEKDKNGILKYLMGSIAIHIFNVDFLIDFTRNIPVHFARKKVKGYSFKNKDNPEIKEIEAVKFETFVFDSIPVANNSVFFETDREKEFYPLKNKTGVDSIETCTSGQNQLFYKWLTDTGIITEKYNNQSVEISPLFSPNFEIFQKLAEKYKDRIKKAVYSNGKINEAIYIE